GSRRTGVRKSGAVSRHDTFPCGDLPMILTRLTLLAAVVVLEGIALGQNYFVSGEVTHPGTYPLSDRSSMMRAISVAGGLTKVANPEKIVIIRENREIPVNV